MINPSVELYTKLKKAVSGNVKWEHRIEALSHLYNSGNSTLHIAIFIEPFLQFVLDGTKTLESRFSVNKQAPYLTLNRYDIVLVKRSGGPIVAISYVEDVWYYELDPSTWNTIKDDFSVPLCINNTSFWDQKSASQYATLMRLVDVFPISPIEYKKRDQRGWVIVDLEPVQAYMLEL